MTKKRAMKLMMACLGGGQRNMAEKAVTVPMAAKLTNEERVALFAEEGVKFAIETAWTTSSAGIRTKMDEQWKRCIFVRGLLI